MPSSTALNIPSKLLTGFLTFAFLMAGSSKLYPGHPMHAEMVEKAPTWLDIFPLSPLGVTPTTLRIAIGCTEVFFALLLIATPAAAYGLAFVMAGAIYTHYTLDGQRFTPDVIPASVLLVLIGVLVALQGPLEAAREREAAQNAAAEGKRE